MSFLERCPSYRGSNEGSKNRQGPTLGVTSRESTVICSFMNDLVKENERVESWEEFGVDLFVVNVLAHGSPKLC